MGILLSVLVVLSILFGAINYVAVPKLLHEQLTRRAESVARLFATTVLEHFSLRDYIGANLIAHSIVELPDVAYAILLKSDGKMVVGILASNTMFDQEFVTSFRKRGFAHAIVKKIRLTDKEMFKTTMLQINGLNVLEHGMRLKGTEAEVHVGFFETTKRHYMYNLLHINDVLLPYALAFLILLVLSIATVIVVVKESRSLAIDVTRK